MNPNDNGKENSKDNGSVYNTIEQINMNKESQNEGLPNSINSNINNITKENNPILNKIIIICKLFYIKLYLFYIYLEIENMDKKNKVDYPKKEKSQNVIKDDAFNIKEDYSIKKGIIENMEKKRWNRLS